MMSCMAGGCAWHSTAPRQLLLLLYCRILAANQAGCASHLILAACCLICNGLSCSRWPVVIHSLASAGVTATRATDGAGPCQPFHHRGCSGKHRLQPPTALAVQHVQHNQSHASSKSATPVRCRLLPKLSQLLVHHDSQN